MGGKTYGNHIQGRSGNLEKGGLSKIGQQKEAAGWRQKTVGRGRISILTLRRTSLNTQVFEGGGVKKGGDPL